MNDIDNMTATQIADEMRELRKRQRDGQLTAGGARRLDELAEAASRIRHAGNRWFAP